MSERVAAGSKGSERFAARAWMDLRSSFTVLAERRINSSRLLAGRAAIEPESARICSSTSTCASVPPAPNELIPRLRAIAAERQNDKIFLRADGSVQYETVMQVMGALVIRKIINIKV